MSGRWTWTHWLAVGSCLVVFVGAGLIAVLVFEQAPHLEDEVAYLFQAQIFSTGQAYADSPVPDSCFFAPFVLDHEGRRFGKYPPGWPALLALGVRMGCPWWVNAACAALTVALTFRLGCEFNDQTVGGIAAGLAAISPFVLMLAGSLMAHTSCLAFITAFLWCFKRSSVKNTAVRERCQDAWAWAAGLSLGAAFVIRPYTAAVMALPAGLYAVWQWRRAGEWRRLWLIGLGFASLALLVPIFNAIWTGDPLLSPYILFWPYDRIGFGPGHGPLPQGNTFWMGLGEAVLVIGRLAIWLHGWPALSMVFVILNFLFKPRRFWELFLAATALTLILAYVAYWTNGDLFGPRYAYEAASALFVLSAGGIVRVWQWAQKRGAWRRWALGGGLALLTCINLFVYLPWQGNAYDGLFGITARPKVILTQANLHNALVIVRMSDNGWKEYAVAFTMNTPTLDGDVVYARECGTLTGMLLEQFPGRRVYYFDGRSVQPRAVN